MYEQTDFSEMWGRCAQVQRDLWQGWTKALEGYKPESPWEQAPHDPLEIGVDMLKRLINRQTDFLNAAMGWRGGARDLPILASQYLETMQGVTDGWLELQRRAYGLWLEAMLQMDPIRYSCTDVLMKAAQGWMLACGKLTEQALQRPARFMSSATLSEAAEAPFPNKPQARKERRRVARAAIA